MVGALTVNIGAMSYNRRGRNVIAVLEGMIGLNVPGIWVIRHSILTWELPRPIIAGLTVIGVLMMVAVHLGQIACLEMILRCLN